MERKQFEQVLVACGWERDRFGHYHKSARGKQYRVKMQDRSCRIETLVRHEATMYSPERKEWIRLGGEYYSKIVELPDGRVRVGKHVFSQKFD